MPYVPKAVACGGAGSYSAVQIPSLQGGFSGSRLLQIFVYFLFELPRAGRSVGPVSAVGGEAAAERPRRDRSRRRGSKRPQQEAAAASGHGAGQNRIFSDNCLGASNGQKFRERPLPVTALKPPTEGLEEFGQHPWHGRVYLEGPSGYLFLCPGAHD